MTTKLLNVDSHTIELSHADKVLFPRDGITKRDLADYYYRVAEAMLPHLRGRPVTMHRFPDGLEGEGFYQKEISSYFPEWIRRASLEKEGGTVTYLLCEDAATLVYMASQACITPHVWLSRADRSKHPDLLIFDLDPPDGSFEPVRQAAWSLRDLLDELGLVPFVKSTGSRGLHVAVPLDRSASFDEVYAFAEKAAQRLASRNPERLTTEQRKEKREGRVFVDVMRNNYGQMAVAPYAVRALPGAPIAVPLDWDELRDETFHPRKYNMRNILTRLSRKAEPWRELYRHAHSLSEAKQRLEKASG